jgi:hypothetical protein
VAGAGDVDGEITAGAGAANGAVAGSAGGGAGALSPSSLANTGVPPYSTAAVRGTMSQRWSTPQRMGGPAESGVRHYM